MSSTRHVVLTAVALVLWSPLYRTHSAETAQSSPVPATAEWPTENSISNIITKQPSDGGEWLIEFDYAFVGKPPAQFRIDVIMQPGTAVPAGRPTEPPLLLPTPGRHHMSTIIPYPGEGTSTHIVVSLVEFGLYGRTLVSRGVDNVIQWPMNAELNLRYAVDAIDIGSRERISEARAILERIIAKKPDFAPAYIEMARVAMKTNWGPEGLHHGETLLDSALKLDPHSTDAKILLGYVYTHQSRFSEAEGLFKDAARSNPVNLWLWTNWGEMLQMQGKAEQAIAKYREAIARPMETSKSYMAQRMAYKYLLKLLEERKDFDGLEMLYKKSIAETGPPRCHGADYARFKLHVRGDAQGAIDLARAALDTQCDGDPARQIIGLANYVKWAKGTASSTEALNQARTFLPPGPMTLYLLADSDHTVVAAEKLVASGTLIDQLDNDHMTALGLALQMSKLHAAERLLRLGARPETPVTHAEIPAALLPVLDGNVDAIRALQRAGVDYSKLKFQGATAIDYAKQMGDEELLKVLQPKGMAL